jgi:hypothetical protein
MSLSRKKKLKLERADRVKYVMDRSYTGSIASPFMDAHWDEAARKYIEEGGDYLKTRFPATVQGRNS